MSCKLKSIVVFLRILSNFILLRNFGKIIKKYCSNLTITLAFGSFKVKNLIKVKDSVPRSLRSRVVYKFKCAGCNSVYAGETYDTFQLESVSIFAQIKIHTFINTYKAIKHVKILVMRAALKLSIQLKRTIS